MEYCKCFMHGINELVLFWDNKVLDVVDCAEYHASEKIGGDVFDVHRDAVDDQCSDNLVKNPEDNAVYQDQRKAEGDYLKWEGY